MIPIFLGLCLAAFATAGIAFFALPQSGISVPTSPQSVERHQLLGLFASILMLVAQSAVFVYFLGTGKAIKTAVEKRGLDPELAARTRRLKGKTFPFATFSSLAVVAAAVLGGAASPSTHATWMGIALALNLIAMPFEVRSIRENSKLMDQTGDQLERAETVIIDGGGSLEEPDQAPGSFIFGRWLIVISISIWLVYGYQTIVMRADVNPWPWYAIGSAGCLLAGAALVAGGLRKKPASAKS